MTASFASLVSGVSGTAFKGPYQVGSSVTLLTLAPDLSQVGTPFFGDVTSADGRYRVDADLAPGVIELIVSGPFFHEVLNATTTDELTLRALTEPADNLSINLLTAIERDRVRALTRQGLAFSAAKEQALAELFGQLGATPIAVDSTAVSLESPDAPVLLMLTAILVTQPDGSARSVQDIQELLTILRTDFENGSFSAARNEVLFASAAAVDEVGILANLAAHYQQLGIGVALPSFSDVLANFLSIIGFQVEVTVSSGGEVDSPDSVWILPGSVISFTVTPAPGSTIESASGCGGSLTDNTYTTAPIYSSCAVQVTFQEWFTVRGEINFGRGTISPSVITIQPGLSTSFSVTAASGYVLDSVTGCGGSLTGNVYTTAPISSNCSVSVSLGLEAYRVTQISSPGMMASWPALTEVGEIYWLEHDGVSMHVMNRLSNASVRNLWSYAIPAPELFGRGLHPILVNSVGDFVVTLPSTAHPSAASYSDAFVNGANVIAGTGSGALFLSEQRKVTAAIYWASSEESHRTLEVFDINGGGSQRFTFEDLINVHPMAINSQGQIVVTGGSETGANHKLFLFREGEVSEVATGLSDSCGIYADISDVWLAYYTCPHYEPDAILLQSLATGDVTSLSVSLEDEWDTWTPIRVDSAGRVLFLKRDYTYYDPQVPWAGGRPNYSLQQWDASIRRELAVGVPGNVTAHDPGVYDMSDNGKVALVRYAPECDPPSTDADPVCGDWDIFVADQITGELTRVTDLPPNTIVIYVTTNSRGEVVFVTQSSLTAHVGYEPSMASTWRVWLAAPR